jgi:hypothetical protein
MAGTYLELQAKVNEAYKRAIAEDEPFEELKAG